ncbi:MAG: hypothetical protein ABI623_09365 [bacterium]
MNKQRSILFVSLLLCVMVRGWVWYASNTTLEDALITFRYVDNIVAGEGFVFNKGEHVLGTTTPLWTLFLSATTWLGGNVIVASKVLGIILDSATLLLMFSILVPFSAVAFMFFAALFVSSPFIAPIAVSGMETSLVLFAMTLAYFGFMRKNIWLAIGIAVLILTRIDGGIFSGILCVFSFFKDKKWTAHQILIAILLILPWFVSSQIYFGSVVPQSALAKTSIYNFDFITTIQPILAQFTPFTETTPLKILAKSMLFGLIVFGSVLTFRKFREFLPLALFFIVYCLALGCSGVLIFRWYLVPAIFVSYILIALGMSHLAGTIPRISSAQKNIVAPLAALTILIVHTTLLQARIGSLTQLQQFEVHVRKEIGIWLKENATKGSVVFLEPLGYIGYYAGTDLVIRDEIGLVAPQVLQYRLMGDGWYVPCLKALRPNYIVQYAHAMKTNASEGTGQKLFSSAEDKQWFDQHFGEVKRFDARTDYPSLEEKEKQYIIFSER